VQICMAEQRELARKAEALLGPDDSQAATPKRSRNEDEKPGASAAASSGANGPSPGPALPLGVSTANDEEVSKKDMLFMMKMMQQQMVQMQRLVGTIVDHNQRSTESGVVGQTSNMVLLQQQLLDQHERAREEADQRREKAAKAEKEKKIRELDEKVTTEMDKVAKLLEKNLIITHRTRKQEEKIAEEIAILERGEYPKTVREFQLAGNREELDDTWDQCRDEDAKVEIVIPRGLSCRDAMKTLHQKAYFYIRKIERDSLSAKLEKFKLLIEKKEFLETMEKIPESMEAAPLEGLGVEELRTSAVDLEIVRAKAELMYQSRVVAANKVIADIDKQAKTKKEVEAKNAAALDEKKPETLLTNYIKKVVGECNDGGAGSASGGADEPMPDSSQIQSEAPAVGAEDVVSALSTGKCGFRIPKNGQAPKDTWWGGTNDVNTSGKSNSKGKSKGKWNNSSSQNGGKGNKGGKNNGGKGKGKSAQK